MKSIFDVMTQCTQVIQVYYKVKQSQIDPESTICEELSSFFMAGFEDIPDDEMKLILAILNADLTLPVCGDTLLSLREG